jgi:hypothetical protein
MSGRCVVSSGIRRSDMDNAVYQYQVRLAELTIAARRASALDGSDEREALLESVKDKLLETGIALNTLLQRT